MTGFYCIMNRQILGENMQEKKQSKTKRFFKQISYAILPFFIFVAVLLVTYFGNQLIYNLRGGNYGSNYPEIPLDSQVPLIPWFVYFYYLTFPLGLITFFYLAYKNKKAFYDIFLTLVISFAVSGIVYLFAQTYFVKPDFIPESFTDWLVVWTWGSTNPVNVFPSQHCFMAFATILAVFHGGKGINKVYKFVATILAIMVILSTIFIRQHYIMDIFASFDIMLIAFGIVLLFGWGSKMKKRQEEKTFKRMMKKKKA